MSSRTALAQATRSRLPLAVRLLSRLSAVYIVLNLAAHWHTCTSCQHVYMIVMLVETLMRPAYPSAWVSDDQNTVCSRLYNNREGFVMLARLPVAARIVLNQSCLR